MPASLAPPLPPLPLLPLLPKTATPTPSLPFPQPTQCEDKEEDLYDDPLSLNSNHHAIQLIILPVFLCENLIIVQQELLGMFLCRHHHLNHHHTLSFHYVEHRVQDLHGSRQPILT